MIGRNMSGEAAAKELGVSSPTVRKYANQLAIDCSHGLSNEDIEKIKEAIKTRWPEKKIPEKTTGEQEMDLLQLADLLKRGRTTIASHAHSHSLGKKVGRKLLFSKEEVKQIQSYYAERPAGKDWRRVMKEKRGFGDLNDAQDNLTISQVGRLVGVNQGTIRSFIERHSLGQKRNVGNRKGVLVLSKEEIKQIQDHYHGRKNKGPIKETLADLVGKSDYLVYVPGFRQLSGFSDVEKIKEFVQNSLLTGQIIIYRKVPAKIDVRLELTEA